MFLEVKIITEEQDSKDTVMMVHDQDMVEDRCLNWMKHNLGVQVSKEVEDQEEEHSGEKYSLHL